MLTKKIFGYGLITVILVFAASLTGCGEPEGGADGGKTDLELSGDISINPASATVGATLNAVYTGDETVTYQWKCDAADLGTATTQAADTEGSYTVTVSAAGYKPKTSAAVNVEAAGQIGEIVATPTASHPSGQLARGQSVTLSTATEDAEIRYTIDGSEPTAASTLYANFIAINASVTVKAIAVKDGITSDVLTLEYTVDMNQLSMPAANPPGGPIAYGEAISVALTAVTAGAQGIQIWYTTDGSNPVASMSTEYTTPITTTITDNPFTIKAIATSSNMTTSGLFTAVYTPLVVTPTADKAAGEHPYGETVTLSTTDGADIHYTTDGSVPTASSTKYTAPITLDHNMTLKAVGIKGTVLSTALSVAYTAKVAAPTATAATVTWGSAILNTTTAGAAIHYTIDGSTPTASSPVATNGIINKANRDATVTLKAIAVKANCVTSDELSSVLTVIVTNTTQLDNYLKSFDANTAATPITVKLNGNFSLGNSNQSQGTVGYVLKEQNNDKYVSLDLSGITDADMYGQAFDGTKLTSVTIGNSIVTFDGQTSYGSPFWGCSDLTAIEVVSANTHYSSDGGVLYDKAKTTLLKYPPKKAGASFTIPNAVTSIGYMAFYESSNLTSVIIGNSVTSIGDWAFSESFNLASVTIGNSVTTIGEVAFANCGGLTSITTPAI